MKFCADSSFVVRLYDPPTDQFQNEAICRFLENGEKTLTVSELCRIEVLNVLLRNFLTEGVEEFERDLKEGVRVRLEVLDWADAFKLADSLVRRFSRALKPGGHDLMLVAAAVSSGASCFLSFDRNSNQRVLAAAAGLKVWPALDKDEKGLLKHAMQQSAR